MNRSVRQHILRWLLALALLFSPFLGDLVPLPLFPVALGALLANDGLEYRSVAGTLVLALVAELAWGLGLGTVSLPYLAAALFVRLTERFISFVPLSHERGWSIAPLWRAVFNAGLLTVGISAASVLVQSVVYRSSSFIILWSSLYRPVSVALVTTVAASAGVLIILHRIDVPFRRPIIFGT